MEFLLSGILQSIIRLNKDAECHSALCKYALSYPLSTSIVILVSVILMSVILLNVSSPSL
jgi:hypothetical protein